MCVLNIFLSSGQYHIGDIAKRCSIVHVVVVKRLNRNVSYKHIYIYKTENDSEVQCPFVSI